MAEQIIDKEFVEQSKTFCMMPWVHLHVTQYGTVTPCCQTSWEEKDAFGNINQEKVSDIWHNDKIAAFRKKLKNNEEDYRCVRCYEKEAAGVRSLRQFTNEWYMHHLTVVNSTGENGNIAPEIKPIYWDIRFSNFCNFRCRICGPWSSSKWYQDAAELGMLSKDARLTACAHEPEMLFEQLEDLAPAVEEIFFAGGEPLIMEEHYHILDMLIAKGLTQVKLRYNTNLSLLNFRGKSILEYWKQFPNVWIGASLDGSELRGEYQRKEQNWKQTVLNIISIQKECPDAYLYITPTVSVFNVLHIRTFHKQLVEQRLIDVKDFFITMLEQPEYYCIQMLPDSLKEKVKHTIEEHIEWINQQPSKSAEVKAIARKNFETLVSFMNAKSTTPLIPRFRSITSKLDTMRHENFAEIFPELKSLMEELIFSP